MSLSQNLYYGNDCVVVRFDLGNPQRWRGEVLTSKTLRFDENLV